MYVSSWINSSKAEEGIDQHMKVLSTYDMCKKHLINRFESG